MLTWWSLVRKCLLKSKTEVYILYKRVWSDQETESTNEGGGATSSEADQEYFGAKWRLAYCYKEWSVDTKISCAIRAQWSSFRRKAIKFSPFNRYNFEDKSVQFQFNCLRSFLHEKMAGPLTALQGPMLQNLQS
jgi:hypothetical protein